MILTTLSQFENDILPILNKQQKENNLNFKVIQLAYNFLRLKFYNNNLPNTMENEVSLAISQALTYYINILGENI